MSDFGKRGKRGAGEQEGEPGDWWLLEKDLAEISLSHRSALLLTPKAKESFYEMLSNRQNMNILSEYWILPFAVLFCMVAYALLSIVYYNDGA